MTRNDTPRTLHVLLLDRLADWEAPLVLCELARRGGWRTLPIGLERGTVSTMGGLTVSIERAIGEVEPGEVRALLAVGSPLWEKEIDPISRFLGDVWRAGAVVGAICGATIGVGHAGLLEGRRYTSNDRDTVATRVPASRLGTYVDRPAVRDDRLVTGSALGYVEFAGELLAAIGAIRDDERAGWVAFLRNPPASS